MLTALLSSQASAYQISKYNNQNVKGLQGSSISFQSWSGLTKETRWAIDYASRQWNNKTGVTKLYHSSTQHNTNIVATSDGKNLITKVSFGQTQDMMRTTIILTLVDGQFYIKEADIEINSDVPWNNTGSATCYDVQNCITHEFGHMLGLGDENRATYSESTMYFSAGIGEVKKRTLEQDDINGFNAIYN